MAALLFICHQGDDLDVVKEGVELFDRHVLGLLCFFFQQHFDLQLLSCICICFVCYSLLKITFKVHVIMWPIVINNSDQNKINTNSQQYEIKCYKNPNLSSNFIPNQDSNQPTKYNNLMNKASNESLRHKRGLSQEQYRLEIRSKGESLSLDKKQLTQTRRVNSLGKQPCGKSHFSIQQAKTTRIVRHETQSPQTKNSTKAFSSKLTTIPILNNAPQIIKLDYSHHKIASIPKSLYQVYISLQVLVLSSNEIISIEPLCMMTQLKEVCLDQNLVNFVPKEIKKLKNLQILDLRNNKLWYMSQVVALKDLLKLRVEQLAQNCQIRLQGNSVLATNERSINKLLQVDLNIYNMNKQKKQSQKKNEQSPQNKENYNPNMNATSKIINSTVSKHNRSKSFNQSLLDMSAIIASIPTTNCQLLGKQNSLQMNETLSIEKRKSILQNEKTKKPFTNQLSIRQIISQQLSQKITPEYFDSLIVTKSPQNDQLKKRQAYPQLFRNVEGFDRQVIRASFECLQRLNEIEKKLSLALKIDGIPSSIKGKLQSLNEKLIGKINRSKSILKTFDSFYSIDIKEFSQKVRQFINNQLQEKGSVVEINQFHSHIVQFYLNSNQDEQLKWYEVWLNQYQQFQKLTLSCEKILFSYLQIWGKVQKLSKVSSFLCVQNKIQGDKKHLKDSQKKSSSHHQLQKLNICSSKKSTERKQLNKLLFSETKQKRGSLFCSEKKESLLLSAKTNSATKSPKGIKNIELERNEYQNKKNDIYCLQCPIKDQQILMVRQDLCSQKIKIKKLQEQIQRLKQIIKQVDSFKNQYQVIERKQQKIIEQFQSLKPSTYQNILLEQALAIEDLISQKKGFVDCFKFTENCKITSIQIGNSLLQREKNTHGNKKYLHGSGKEGQVNQRAKVQLNQFLLTEESAQSNKNNCKSVQRTYFKSNGTVTYSQTVQAKSHPFTDEHHRRTSLSSKNRPFTIETKPNPSQDVQSSMSRHSIPIQQSLSNQKILHMNGECQKMEKNEIFQKIIVGEYMKKNGIQNNSDIKYQNVNSDSKGRESFQFQKNKIKKLEQQNISNQFTRNSNLSNSINPQIRNYQKDGISSHKFKSPQLNSSQAQILYLSSKTTPNLLLSTIHQLQPKGYNYEAINLHEKEDYQKYIKYHLRNNIKKVLDQKYQSFDNQVKVGAKKVTSMRIDELNSKTKNNYMNSSLSKMRATWEPTKKETKSLSCQKLSSAGKYIRKRSDSQGK